MYLLFILNKINYLSFIILLLVIIIILSSSYFLLLSSSINHNSTHTAPPFWRIVSTSLRKVCTYPLYQRTISSNCFFRPIASPVTFFSVTRNKKHVFFFEIKIIIILRYKKRDNSTFPLYVPWCCNNST